MSFDVPKRSSYAMVERHKRLAKSENRSLKALHPLADETLVLGFSSGGGTLTLGVGGRAQ